MEEIAEACAEIGWSEAIPQAAAGFYRGLSDERG
jgi:hypothetical protein